MISVIIPTYNEAKIIGDLITFVKFHGSELLAEIIVSDGGSQDNTVTLAREAGAIALDSPQKGRAVQMNHAAGISKGNILYFVHADSIPPKSFAKDIMDAFSAGINVGRYQTKFMSTLFLLRLNAFFTRFDLFSCYGGDQTLFISKALFHEIGGYDITKEIMEDYDITERAKIKGRYKIFDKKTLVSARKYELNSWFKVQRANYRAVRSYRRGVPTRLIAEKYKKTLRF